MFWSMLLILAFQTPATQTPAPDRPTWARFPGAEDAARCTAPLPLQTLNVRAVMRCRLDGGGRPENCTLRTPDALPDDQMTAVRCLLDTYQFEYRDGRSTRGVELSIPIRLQLTGPETTIPQGQ